MQYDPGDSADIFLCYSENQDPLIYEYYLLQSTIPIDFLCNITYI
jgi:hypothetical protein